MSQTEKLKEDAIAIWQAGVAAVDARKLVIDNVAWSKDELRIGTEMFPIPEIDRVVVIGFGKSSAAMAAGFETALGERLFDTFEVSGWINVPDDQVVETQSITINPCRPAGENLPNERVLAGTEKILELISSTGPNDICVCLISGGGSALLEKPVDSISLDDLRTTTTFLGKSGASIYELNAVRRAISQVKGGGLIRRLDGVPFVSLILSDVVGDDIDIIASGPTVVPGPNHQAIEVLKKFDPDQSEIPASVWKVVQSPPMEIVKLPYGQELTNVIIGNVETAMQAAKEKATELGYKVESSPANGNEGNAATIGHCIAGRILEDEKTPEPVCLIAGGESTIELCDSPGQGGRNQHLVLSAISDLLADPIHTNREYCLLSGGTDGEDGNVLVAGAVVDSSWISATAEIAPTGLLGQIGLALERCASHTFLSGHGLIFDAPKTNTNVGDLRIVLKGAPKPSSP